MAFISPKKSALVALAAAIVGLTGCGARGNDGAESTTVPTPASSTVVAGMSSDVGHVTVQSLRNEAVMWPERLVGIAGHARVLDGTVDACGASGQLVSFEVRLADRSVDVVIGPLPIDHRQEAGMVEEAEPVLVRTASEVAASLQDVRVVVGVGATRDTSVFGYLIAQEQPDGLATSPGLDAKAVTSLGLRFDDFEAWLASPDVERVRTEMEAEGREVASGGGLGDPYAIVLEASRHCGEELARLVPSS